MSCHSTEQLRADYLRRFWHCMAMEFREVALSLGDISRGDWLSLRLRRKWRVRERIDAAMAYANLSRFRHISRDPLRPAS